jgi:regulator of sigma E protease
MSWPLATLAAFVGFSALIMLHELGHFAAAKAVGMRVEKFSLFFGPMLVKWRRGETVYGVGPIPLGGYVRISGMNPREELAPEVAPRAYYAQPVWKRIVVIAAGPFMSILTAFVLLWGVFAVNGTAQVTSTVGTIEPAWPAAGVLKPGDKILAVDGHRGDFQALATLVARHKCAGGAPVDGCNAATPAMLTIQRGAKRMTVSVTPRYDSAQKRTRVGFSYRQVPHHYGAAGAAGQSLSTMGEVVTKTGSTFAGIFTSPEKRKQVSSVVGAYETTRKSFELSTAQALFLLGVVSLSLGIINLFPFLPLDGGHIFFAIAEKLRGRAIPFAVMERASVIGIVLVMFVFIIGFTNDIDRLTGRGFGVP